MFKIFSFISEDVQLWSVTSTFPVCVSPKVARQPWRHCVTSLRSAHWLASSLKLAARYPVSGCWPSCYLYMYNEPMVDEHCAYLCTALQWNGC